ncbi:thiol:disulfide interchange protein precursor [Planctomycetes bacterium MalM25]|nr:thiol:disulfide interchange protein precursor [Planctomycetes bacterium MalM25]
MATRMDSTTTESPASESFESPAQPGWGLWLWRWFWRVTLVVSLYAAWYCYYAPSNDVAWAENHAAARQQAAESGKPVLIYFTGEWCVPCRIMKRNVWADEQVATRVNAEFVPVMVDVADPEEADLVSAYKIGTTPITLVESPQGEVMRYHVGGMTQAAFVDFLDADND